MHKNNNQQSSSSKSSSQSSNNDSSSSDSSKSSKNYNKFKPQIHKNSSTIKSSKRSSTSSASNNKSHGSNYEDHMRKLELKKKNQIKEKKPSKRTDNMYYKDNRKESYQDRESFKLSFGQRREYVKKHMNMSRSRSRSSRSRSKDRRKDRESRGRSYKVYGGFDNHRVMKPATNYLKKLEVSKYNELQKKFEINDVLLNKSKNKWDSSGSPKIEKNEETSLKNYKDNPNVDFARSNEDLSR